MGILFACDPGHHPALPVTKLLPTVVDVDCVEELRQEHEDDNDAVDDDEDADVADDADGDGADEGGGDDGGE